MKRRPVTFYKFTFAFLAGVMTYSTLRMTQDLGEEEEEENRKKEGGRRGDRNKQDWVTVMEIMSSSARQTEKEKEEENEKVSAAAAAVSSSSSQKERDKLGKLKYPAPKDDGNKRKNGRDNNRTVERKVVDTPAAAVLKETCEQVR